MTNYTKTTDFAAKDSLPSGDSGKIIRGTEFETEFDNIATAVNSKSDANNPTFTGTVTIDGLTVNGNTVLGNAATDTVTVTADIASNLIPSADDTYNLGAVGAEWNDLHVDGVAYIDTIAGFATTGNVTFGDNNKAIFGASSDLQIYHTGSPSSNSVIEDAGAGNLTLKSNGAGIHFRDGSDSLVFNVDLDSATTLYHNTSAKLATTSTGIDVTGTVTADGLTVQDAVAGGSVIGLITNTDNTADSKAVLELQTNNGIWDISANRSGYLDIINPQNTVSARFSSGNPGDFHLFEDTGTTPKFVWDASAERLGIGNSAPTTALDVTGTVTADGLTVQTAQGDISILNASSSLDFARSGTNYFRATDASGSFRFITGALDFTTKRFDILANGDLQAYEDTGTTPKFVWDASAERLRVGDGPQTINNGANGTFTPKLSHIDDGAAQAGIVIGTGSTRNIRVGLFADDTNGVCGISTRFSSGTNPAFVFRDALSGGNERMRIDAGGNVGIGTTSPQGPLQVQLNSSRNLVVGFDTEGDSRVSLRSIEDVANNLRPIQVEGSEIVLGTAAFDQTVSSEAMRINSGGTVLVGKTSSTSSTVGAELRQNGLIIATTSSVPSLTLNRTTSDGAIAEFRKDNTTVGSIGADSGDLLIGTGITGLRFNDGSNQIIPRNTSGAQSAGVTDLGNSSSRFKDLYLSGGAYLGGVAAANKLDDYEEGTFTPAVEGSTTAGTGTYATRNGQYTKIGNVVHVRIYINMSAHTGAGNLLLTGLPFNAKNQANGFYSASIDFSNGITKTAGRYIFGALRPNTSQIEIQEQNTGSVVTAWNNNVALDVAFQAAITMTYTTA